MEDSPASAIPVTDKEARQFACDLGITGEAKDNWTSITTSTDFQTILICCSEDPPVVMAVYHWNLTVTVTREGANSFSSSVTTTAGGPKEQLGEDGKPIVPSDAEWEMPECES